MSNEAKLSGPTGRTCYVHLVEENNYQWWNGSSIETFSAANYSLYTVSATEEGSIGLFTVDFPADLPAGEYNVIMFLRAGASPAHGDRMVGKTDRPIFWSGASSSTLIVSNTYGSIKNDVRGNLGRGTEVDAFLDQWARYATLEITRWRDNFFLQATVEKSTVVDQQSYDLPSDFRGNLHLSILKSDKWVQLGKPIDLEEAQRRFSPDDTGEPVAWSWGYDETQDADPGQIMLWPAKPDAVYTLQLDYMRYISDLADNDDSNVLTTTWPDLLVAWLTYYAYRHFQEWQDAAQWKKEATRLMADLHAAYVARTLGHEFTFRPRADTKGHGEQERGIGTYLVIR